MEHLFHFGQPDTRPMQFFEQLLHNLGLSKQPTAVSLDPELLPFLEKLAVQEGCTVAEMAESLLYNAVHERRTAVSHLQLWAELTPREKQTAVLACLGHTNQEIASRMVISTNTVKTHMRHILRKFNVGSKEDLRALLADWDFSDWLEGQELIDTAGDQGLANADRKPETD